MVTRPRVRQGVWTRELGPPPPSQVWRPGRVRVRVRTLIRVRVRVRVRTLIKVRVELSSGTVRDTVGVQARVKVTVT